MSSSLHSQSQGEYKRPEHVPLDETEARYKPQQYMKPICHQSKDINIIIMKNNNNDLLIIDCTLYKTEMERK